MIKRIYISLFIWVVYACLAFIIGNEIFSRIAFIITYLLCLAFAFAADAKEDDMKNEIEKLKGEVYELKYELKNKGAE